MTIALGFHCDNGIVLAADTELTVLDALKEQTSKVRTYEKDGLLVAVTGSGDWDYLRMTFEKFLKVLPGLGSEPTEVLDAFEQVVLNIHETNINLYPSYDRKPHINTLLAVRSPNGELALLKSVDTAFSRHFDFELTGMGELLGRYLGNTLYDRKMTVKQGVFLAAHIVGLAKKHVAGVGGRTDIVTLTSDGHLSQSRNTDVAELEAHFSRLEAIWRPLFLAVPDIRDILKKDPAPDANFREQLETFLQEVKKARAEYEYSKSPFKF